MTDAAIKPGDPIDVIYGDRRFVAWRYERGSNGQPAKIPYTPGLGAKARSNDPADLAQPCRGSGHVGERRR